MEYKLQPWSMHNLSTNCKGSDCHYDLHLARCGHGGRLQLPPATCTLLQKMSKRCNLQPPRWRRQSLKKQPHDDSCPSMSIWLLTMSQFISFPFTPSSQQHPLRSAQLQAILLQKVPVVSAVQEEGRQCMSDSINDLRAPHLSCNFALLPFLWRALWPVNSPGKILPDPTRPCSLDSIHWTECITKQETKRSLAKPAIWTPQPKVWHTIPMPATCSWLLAILTWKMFANEGIQMKQIEYKLYGAGTSITSVTSPSSSGVNSLTNGKNTIYIVYYRYTTSFVCLFICLSDHAFIHP